MFNKNIKCLLTLFFKEPPLFKNNNKNKLFNFNSNVFLGIWIKAGYMHAIHLMHVTIVNAVGVQLLPHEFIKLNFTIAGEDKEIYITFQVTFYSIVFT